MRRFSLAITIVGLILCASGFAGEIPLTTASIVPGATAKVKYEHDHTLEQLFDKIADLLENSPLRPHIAKPDKAPVWIPKNEAGYIVVTCTECLRSFSVPDEATHSEVYEADCIFCGSKVCFLADLKERKKQARNTG